MDRRGSSDYPLYKLREKLREHSRAYCEGDGAKCFQIFGTILNDGNNAVGAYNSRQRELDELVNIVKKATVMGAWVLPFGTCLLDFVYIAPREVKINKKLLQAFCVLEKKDVQSIETCITERISDIENDLQIAPHVTVWCSLVDLSLVARRAVWNHVNLVLPIVVSQMDSLQQLKHATIQNQEYLHSLLKIFLQICQYNQDHLGSRLWPQELDDSSAIIDECLNRMSVHLRQVLIDETVPKDCALLAGTAVCFLLTGRQFGASVFINIWENLVTVPTLSWTNTNLEVANDDTHLTFGHLALINGFLSSARIGLFFQDINERDCNLHSYLFRKICDLCYVIEFQYHSFKLLYQWFQKTSRHLQVVMSCCDTGSHLFDENSLYVQKSLMVIWTHLDSPVDGVNECVIDIFKLLLSLHKQEIDLIEESGVSVETRDSNGITSALIVSLPARLLPKVIDMSWQVRGKHTMLAALIPNLNITEFLCENPSILDSMLECLSTNYLGPPSTQLYKSILEQMDHESNRLDMFKRYCLQSNLTSLTSKESLLRHNFGHYWLPWTLKIIPETVSLLLTSLERLSGSCGYTLHATVSLLKTARSLQLLKDLPLAQVSESFGSQDDGLRINAFSLICVSPKTVEALSDAEIQLLMRFLPLNMTIDSPPCRQQLSTNLRSAFMRVRDSSLSTMRPTSKYRPSEEIVSVKLTNAIDFVDWFYLLCLDNMSPGSSYQRLKTSLDWLTLILDVFVYIPGNVVHRKKGMCPEAAKDLVEFANKRNKWMFFSGRSATTVLSCLLNGTDDIREEAGHIIMTFFPWPLSIHPEGSASDMTHILLKGFELCNDPRARDCESGAAIIRILFDRLICKARVMVELSREDGRVSCGEQHILHNAEEPCLHIVVTLLNWMEDDISCAETNVLLAAKRSPVHGLISALQRCLVETNLPIATKEKWKECLTRLISLVKKLLDIVLDVFGGNIQTDESAPSFEQMSLGIQQVIATSGENTGMAERDDTVLSIEYQMINTWCWLNIRESSILLGRLGKSVPGNMELFSVSEMQEVSQIFIKILTKCRHRGALEGCNVGFIDLCTWLHSHPNRALQKIPADILDQILSQVTTSSAASITRRSAGLPLIVQSLIACESKTRQTILLAKAINTLFEIVTKPVPDDPDQKVDLPQVHALNILKAVFRESSVAQPLMPYLSTATIHAVEGFASPDWAVRNSSTQLFGTLLSRMLGQKRTREDDLNTTTAPDFFTLYPALFPFLLDNLTSAIAGRDASNESASLKLHPCLFPVLSILARLAPGLATEEAEKMMCDIRAAVVELAASPLFSVRELAAQALIPLVPSQTTLIFICQLLKSLSQGSECVQSQNNLHGKLLQLYCLIRSLTKRNQALTEIAQHVVSIEWVIGSENNCLVTRSIGIQIVSLINQNTASIPDSTTNMLNEESTKFLQRFQHLNNKQVGYALYVTQIIGWYMSSTNVSLTEKLRNCLATKNQDIQICCIKMAASIVSKGENHQDLHLSDIQDILAENIQSEDTPWEVTCELTQLILDIYLSYGIFQASNPQNLWKWSLTLLHKEINSRLAALGLSLLGIILQTCNPEQLLPRCCDDWSSLILETSTPYRSEELRYHCATALVIAGCKLVLAGNPMHIKRLLTATASLLIDVQRDVRCKVAEFVSKLSGGSYPCSQPTLALQTLFRPDLIDRSVFPRSQYVCWLYSLIHHPHSDPVEVVDKEIRNECSEIFESQDINPYRESCQIESLVIESVVALHNKEPFSAPEVATAGDIGLLIDQLDRVTQLLSEYCQKRVLNATCEKCTYETLHGLYTRCAFLFLCAPPEARSSIQGAWESLAKLPGLHPGLRTISLPGITMH